METGDRTAPLEVRVSSNVMKQLRVLIAADASSFLNCPSIRVQVLDIKIRTYNMTLNIVESERLSYSVRMCAFDVILMSSFYVDKPMITGGW